MARQVGGREAAPAYALAGLLAGAGITHFVLPEFYDRIVPHALPASSRSWTILSGLVELTCAAGLVPARSRRLAATCTALLFVLVFPANIQMAVDWRNRSLLERLAADGRLPLQIPLVWWALSVRRAAGTSEGDHRHVHRASWRRSSPS
jgi:uncharacterized membrane protein